MKPYVSTRQKLSGTSYSEIERRARSIYNTERKRTKRIPYVRSSYFNKDKVFLSYYWNHLNEKHRRDRKLRLQYYDCALDLIRHTRMDPISKDNPNKRSEIVHRFFGVTKSQEAFVVHIAENKKSGNKHFMSVFPSRKAS